VLKIDKDQVFFLLKTNGCYFFYKMSTIGKRLQKFMDIKGFTQQRLADETRISRPTISIYIKTGNIPESYAYLLELKYNLSSEWLLKGKKPMFLPEERRILLGLKDKVLLDFFDENPKLKKTILDICNGKELDKKALTLLEKMILLEPKKARIFIELLEELI